MLIKIITETGIDENGNDKVFHGTLFPFSRYNIKWRKGGFFFQTKNRGFSWTTNLDVKAVAGSQHVNTNDDQSEMNVASVFLS